MCGRVRVSACADPVALARVAAWAQPPGIVALRLEAVVPAWGLVSGPCCARLVCLCIFVSLPCWCGWCGLVSCRPLAGAPGSALPQVLGLPRAVVSLLFREGKPGRVVIRSLWGVTDGSGENGRPSDPAFPRPRRSAGRLVRVTRVSPRAP